jgi:hypothetical protein
MPGPIDGGRWARKSRWASSRPPYPRGQWCRCSCDTGVVPTSGRSQIAGRVCGYFRPVSVRSMPAHPRADHLPRLRSGDPVLPRLRACMVRRSTPIPRAHGHTAVSGSQTLVVELVAAYHLVTDCDLAFTRPGFQTSPQAWQRQYAVDESARLLVMTRADRHDGHSGMASARGSGSSDIFAGLVLYG